MNGNGARVACGENRAPRFGIKLGPMAGITRGGFGDDLIGKQVGACPFGPIVARRGYEELSRSVEVVGIPSGPMALLLGIDERPTMW